MSGVFRTTRTPTKSGFSPVFRWIYWREYTASEPAFRLAIEGGELQRLKVQLLYDKRQQKGLWWWATCVMNVSSKSSLRRHYAKLLRKGFESALKEKGYAKDGSRLIQDGREELVGTLQMLGSAKMVDPSWKNVQDHCGRVLDAIERQDDKPKALPAASSLSTSKQRRTSHQKLGRRRRLPPN